MALGGSITAGVGSSDFNGYRKHLLEMIRSSGCDICMVGSRRSGSTEAGEHEGWRGFRLDEIEKKARKSVPRLKPNLFTINAGSNDCIQKLNIDDFGKRMSAMLNYLWLASPGSTILLSTLVCNADQEINSQVLRVNDQIRTLVRQKATHGRIILADMYTERGPTFIDLVDGTHPGDAGYRKMADVWFSGFQEAAIMGFIGNTAE
ncbi:SGNH hydrolase [Aspergillus uvarum CBS 121591]|uniref:SGNH hydrolase n=1 Tax=Aspergillus uvarum CBS 121591 TaxID=1448315 RepID=A0A319BV95_9EURO|nr:SGNH hydrolase [Aspergillus uvarum CBS 121591]PYH76331.1 SGNH hydrolase [Aspergillus uvarum CBS 121591]